MTVSVGTANLHASVKQYLIEDHNKFLSKVQKQGMLLFSMVVADYVFVASSRIQGCQR